MPQIAHSVQTFLETDGSQEKSANGPENRSKKQVGSSKEDATMIEHIALFRFKKEATPEQIQAVMAGLQDLQKAIPGILETQYGKNFSKRAQGYTYVVTTRFANRAALDAFYPHPAHQRLVAERLKPILDDLLVVDYLDQAKK